MSASPSSNPKSCTVYVLECEGNRYYVGKTYQQLPENRIMDHFESSGSEWTKTHQPIKVCDIKLDADVADEDVITKKYMMQYGIENVRGGSYSQVELPEYKIQALQDEIASINDLCFNCQKPGHFASSCPRPRKSLSPQLVKPSCNRCRREGHTVNECYATYDVEGSLLEDTCSRCGRKGHSTNECYAHQHVNGSYLKKQCRRSDQEEYHYAQDSPLKSFSTGCCFRCGRSGHFASDCYARRDVYSNYLSDDSDY